jgi:hypothetical protein
MASPRFRQKVAKLLYACSSRGVTCALALTLVLAGTFSWAQYGRKPKPSAGPRAIGLLELAADGKGHLVPVVILYNGQYYDASSYKAAPVPMALDSGTVYEAEKSGVPQGLFTVSGALHFNDNRWVGAGTWEAAGSKPAKKAPPPEKKPEEDLDTPPVLRRPGSPAATSTPPPSPKPAEKPAPEAKSETKPEPAKEAESTPPVEQEAPDDPERPVLRRGKQTPASAPMPKMTDVKAPAKLDPSVTVMPAISDAGGPEPRSYLYSMKPEDEQNFRKKMLAIAVVELGKYQKRGEPPSAAQPATARKGKTQPPSRVATPKFEDVQLKVFDLSTNNEPVLVLTAKALPAQATATPDQQYSVTLVARETIYGELNKPFVKITDTHHLDAFPRYELIDAVDADGDGRGELLFREVSDAGKAFILYRVIGDQLWSLYESAPQ